MEITRKAALVVSMSALVACAAAQSTITVSKDEYSVLLHSRSLADQRNALQVIMTDPQKYVPRIQQDLREYPRLLKTNRVAAERIVYLSSLLRDPSFPPILVKSLENERVVEDCIYACPAVFALTIHACFAGWKVPVSLDSRLTTVHDLGEGIAYMSRISLKVGSLEDKVSGPSVEEHRKEVEGKTEEQLIRLAGPMTRSPETRMFAAYQLETTVSKSKNRIDLYLLAMNALDDASGEYRDAIHQSIYRAELAKSRGK